MSKIERGIYSPSISLLKKIAAVYGVDFVHLLDETEKLTTTEERLMYDLDLSSEEPLKKYTLLLDGQKLMKEESISSLIRCAPYEMQYKKSKM